MDTSAEHVFAQYVRILGRGKNTSKSLTREEAYEAFTHILKNEVEEIQLGAFLLLLRVKGEDENEMAGFAEAAQHLINAPSLAVDIDWPSYAGKHKQQPWYILAALLLAANGHKIAMHASTHTTNSRIYAAQILQELGISSCNNWQDIEKQLDTKNFAFIPMDTLCPALDKLFSYRSVLGVRSPVNSLIKLVNPLRANTSLQSVFHPAYLNIHQKAALLLKHRQSLVLKGEGGEIEFRPDAENRLFLLHNGTCSIETWHRTQSKRQPDLELKQLSTDRLKNFWAGRENDDYALNAILGTVAMVLFASKVADTEQEAWSTARNYWHSRDRELRRK